MNQKKIPKEHVNSAALLKFCHAIVWPSHSGWIGHVASWVPNPSLHPFRPGWAQTIFVKSKVCEKQATQLRLFKRNTRNYWCILFFLPTCAHVFQFEMHFFFQILWSYIDVVFDWNICFTNCQPIKIRFSETHGNIKNMSSQKKEVQTSFYSAPTFPIASPPGWVEKRRHFIRPMHLEFRLKTRWICMKVLIHCGFIFWQKNPVLQEGGVASTCCMNQVLCTKICRKSFTCCRWNGPAVLGWWTSWTMDTVLVCCKPMILGNHHLLAMANDMLLPLHSAGTPIWSRICLYLPCYTPGR